MITAAANETAVDVAVTRTFGLNYGTLCLPFALTSDEIKASGIRKLYEVTGSTAADGKFKTTTKKVSETEAGKAYMIHFKVAASWNMQIFENKAIVADAVESSFTGVKFKGTFAPVQLPAGDKTKLFVQQGGTGFTYPKAGDTTKLPAFRAWFEKSE